MKTRTDMMAGRPVVFRYRPYRRYRFRRWLREIGLAVVIALAGAAFVAALILREIVAW